MPFFTFETNGILHLHSSQFKTTNFASMNNSFGYYLLKKIEQLAELDIDTNGQVEKLYRVMVYMFDEIARRENIHLTSLFSKIAYFGNRYKLPKTLLFHLHGFRKSKQDKSDELVYNGKDFELYRDSVYFAIHSLFSIKISTEFKANYFAEYKSTQANRSYTFIKSLEVLALSAYSDTKIIYGLLNQEPFEEVSILWDQPEENDIYSESIQGLIDLKLFPVALHLHLIKSNDKRELIPGIIVIEPSYLIDVTTISNCFQPHGSESRDGVVRKFMTVNANAAIMRGNIANFLLDELVHQPDLTFEDIKKKVFAINPLAFSQFDDKTVIELMKDVESHFHKIKKTIQIEFTKNGISKDNIYIEPAFYSPHYGIQGRLDLLHVKTREKVAAIIELKGGKPYRPNRYGLNSSHYHQTLLYDLLIHSSFGDDLRVNNFILYSGVDQDNLRYAPQIKYQQKEAIRVRNDLYLQQLKLELLSKDQDLLGSMKKSVFPKLKGFAKNDIAHFEKVYQNLDELEQSFLRHFSSFVAREQRLSKIGSRDVERMNGLASIWQNSIEEKMEAFTVINHLELVKNESEDDIPVLRFQHSAKTAELSNFRVGDISVLYPDFHGKQDSALRTQVLKGTILELNEKDVLLRLRSRQYNHQLFKNSRFWHIEHDRLDNGFNAMYRSLFEFIESSQSNRDLWLGKKAPFQNKTIELPVIEEFTDEQQEIFDEIISAEDYYLLWGPPGTGKTSFIVRHVVRHLFFNTNENILLLAYTNKAVDEICDAICAIQSDFKHKFLRIGSRYGASPKYSSNLLINISESMTRRTELVGWIQRTRLFTGTVASIMGKSELFRMKKFDRIIIDEASQLLEPNILGILSRFRKSILIGDHRQLPAVVQQTKKESQIKDTALSTLGFNNMADSLFERLYTLCESKNWYWAIGQLNAQGRMHKDIMAFPNQNFYQSQLTALTKIDRLTESLKMDFQNDVEQVLATKRLVYVPSKISDKDLNFKMNTDESRIVFHLVSTIQKIQKANHKNWSIGIITPYRAQIANIRSYLIQKGVDIKNMTIDTVERYQGGARDIIILSFSVNHAIQLNSLAEVNEQGVDRKLNVALTRAKEQIIITGHEAILQQNPIYKSLLESYYKCKM